MDSCGTPKTRMVLLEASNRSRSVVDGVPIIVGVTGHRDLSEGDVPRITETVCRILAETLSRYPHSPVELVTGLAGGADQLATRAALEYRNDQPELGARLRISAVLPMPRATYRASLDAEKPCAPGEMTELQGFDELIAFLERESHPERIIELPFVDEVGVPLEVGTPEESDQRSYNRQYSLLGDYFVKHSQVLMAIWSGVKPEPDKVGGTGSIVVANLSAGTSFNTAGALYGPHLRETIGNSNSQERALSFVTDPNASVLQQPDYGPVYWIPARRTGANRRPSETSEWEPSLDPQVDCFYSYELTQHGVRRALTENGWIELYPAFWNESDDGTSSSSMSVPEYYRRPLLRIDEYNAELSHLPSGSEKQSMSQIGADHVPMDARLKGYRYVAAHFGMADTAANTYDRKASRHYTALLISVVLAFTAFSIFDLFPFLPSTGLLLGFPLILLLGFFFFRIPLSELEVDKSRPSPSRWKRRRNLEKRHYGYRTFAEALRVKYFWLVAGVEERIPGRFIRRYRGDLKWVEYAAGTVSRWADAEAWQQRSLSSPERIAFVQQRWVEDQRNYFRKTLKVLDRQAKRVERFQRFAFGLAMASALLLLFGAKLLRMLETGDFSTWWDLTDMQLTLEGKTSLVYAMGIALTDLLMAVGVAYTAHTERQNVKDEMNEYHSQLLVFSTANRRIEEARSDQKKWQHEDLPYILRVLAALGREAVVENAD